MTATAAGNGTRITRRRVDALEIRRAGRAAVAGNARHFPEIARPLLVVLGTIALSAGALASLVISMTDAGLFGYTEPTFRSAVVIAMAAEAAAIVLLLAYLATRRRTASGC